MRTQAAVRNLATAWIGQLLIVIGNFISRFVFTRVLPTEYLGVNGLFTNVLSLLSLVDLGIGISLAYYLYGPIARGDEGKIRQYMVFFRKVYHTIAIAVLVVGVALLPVLPWLLNDDTSIEHIELIYLLYVVNSSLSYLYAYKATLIDADQKQYVNTSIRNVVKLIQIALGIVVLLLFSSYIGYYSLQLLATLGTNLWISRKANLLYPFLKEKAEDTLSQKEKQEFWKNTRAMFCHQFGTVVINGTDNILISKLVSLLVTGLYSNYLVLINALTNLITQIFSSVTAGIGDFTAVKDAKKKTELFYSIFFLNFAVIHVCTVCLWVLFQPFVSMWLGEQYLLDISVVVVLVLNFYLQGMRNVNLTFRNAMGLFYRDRWKAIIEAFLNLVLSIGFGLRWGILGILLGTTFSMILTCLWVEPLILFHHGLEGGLVKYFGKYMTYFLETLACCILCNWICSFLLVNWETVILRGVFGLVISLGTMFLFYGKTAEWAYLQEQLKKVFQK